ncbi:uncharacterized protein LOC123004045 [Tribolium madens]|uniref:uncharacterized protein LOC123004045 n=1 Tax=Tribolium madens TaxID=41895 RepID=UPI001CF75E03|nr:uncharacterized protein LOC123004045 [Tribolium madens]
MVLGAFHLKSEEHIDFDMSFTHMEDAAYWLVPKAKPLPLWKRLKMPTFKTLIITWIAYCLVISTVFKSKLMNVMTENIYENQIESLSEIQHFITIIPIPTKNL